MFGWELPPYNSGGLGTACLGMTEGLAPLGINVDFVIPDATGDYPYQHMRILSAAKYRSTEEIKKILKIDEDEQSQVMRSLAYGNELSWDSKHRLTVKFNNERISLPPHRQAAWYAYQAAAIAEQGDYDVIHCHDWMTYYCGIAAQKVAASKGKHVPFVAHVHATEIDRCGENGDPAIVAIEKAGLQAADLVIAVSHYTKQLVHKRYGIPLKKIEVVHNGVPANHQPARYDLHELKKYYKLVLFLGRITYQKGPDYFLRIAKQVTDQDPKVKFIMVGSGDMEKRCIEQAAHLGLTGKILFSSFLRGGDVDRAFQMADLFLMPSVSEPFGIVALEALQNGTPVIVSNQSGVAEVAPHLPRADFWDIDALSEKVLYILSHPEYADQICQKSAAELGGLSWDTSASKLHAIYSSIIRSFALQHA